MRCALYVVAYLDKLLVEGLASVKYYNIKVVLVMPNQCGSTINQRLSLTLLNVG